MMAAEPAGVKAYTIGALFRSVLAGAAIVFIDTWEWDDGNLEELSRHGLDRRIVEQVASESPRFRRNKKARAASHAMVGPDRGGRIWIVCIVPQSGQPGLWRAITGWRADRAEADWYWRSG